jgi:hypothetical protein
MERAEDLSELEDSPELDDPWELEDVPDGQDPSEDGTALASETDSETDSEADDGGPPDLEDPTDDGTASVSETVSETDRETDGDGTCCLNALLTRVFSWPTLFAILRNPTGSVVPINPDMVLFRFLHCFSADIDMAEVRYELYRVSADVWPAIRSSLEKWSAEGPSQEHFLVAWLQAFCIPLTDCLSEVLNQKPNLFPSVLREREWAAPIQVCTDCSVDLDSNPPPPQHPELRA